MKVSRRFQLTVQTVLFIAVYSDKKEMTCENISKEMKCNPVVIKNILNIFRFAIISLFSHIDGKIKWVS